MKHAEKNRFARTGVCRNVCMGLRLGALAVSLALCGLLAGCGSNGADPAEKAIVDDVAAGVEAYDSVLSALGVDPQTGVVEGGGEVSEGLRHPVQTDLTPVTLERVVDGDTIVVEMNGTRERVRLIGINTPESVAPEQERNTEEGKAVIAIYSHNGYLPAKSSDYDSSGRPGDDPVPEQRGLNPIKHGPQTREGGRGFPPSFGMEKDTMIEFEEVEKRYPNGYEALKHINLTIDQGEFVAIIGLSGAGKSTLIRTINRMHDITRGTLTVDGTDVMTLHGKSLRKFRRKIGMIFQSFNLITRTTVIKNVLTAFVPDLPWWRATFGIFTKEEKMKALEALDQMGILDKAFVRADQLSGGQQQRVALARTLAQNPQIILADEPVASLDPVTAKQVMDDFQRINRDMHITVLINIHHVELALQYATRVVGIRAGEIVYDGPADQVDQAILDAIYQGKQEEPA